MVTKLVLVERFLDIFFPRKCVGCRKEGFWICEMCGQVEGALWRVDEVTALYSLEERVIREAVHTLKYNGVFEMAEVLVEMVSRWCTPADLFPAGAVLVPVPMSVKRERQRGYNQAALLAQGFGKWAGLEVREDVLVKRDVKTQVGKGAEEREASLAGAFSVKNTARVAELRDQPVVVIDDVYTTGSTLRAVQEVLKVAGLTDVRGLVLARMP